jgi:hypothetical protein
MPQYASTLIVGKNYKLRLWTKEELRARVTGETGNQYLLMPMDKSSLGPAGEQVSVNKLHVKLLEEIP